MFQIERKGLGSEPAVVIHLIILFDDLQFPLPHTRGSSTGQSRGIEKTADDSATANMGFLKESYPYWRQLEIGAGENLFE
jgi:hypothetical protein